MKGYASRPGLRMQWLVAAAVLLPGFWGASASVTASIAVNGSVQGSDSSNITVSFNGFSETVHYDSTSTANSVASGFAAMFSRDYLKSGLCATATGNVITVQLKTGVFTPVAVTDSNTSFQLAASGFPAGTGLVANAGGPYSGTAGTQVSFSGAGSSDLQGQTLTYAWNFGDGAAGTGVSPTHTYAVAGSYTVSLTVTDTASLMATATSTATIATAAAQSDAPLTGHVFGGQQAVSGAHVYLMAAANTTGYGQPSLSLLSAANTEHFDSVGAYVLTDANGNFNLGGDYTCTSGQQLYLYAQGGNSGFGANPVSGLVAAIGSCPSAAVTVTVNEVSTVVAAYALSGFMTDATHVSSSLLGQVGIANAFGMVHNLVNIATGAARTTAVTPPDGAIPQSEINTLADILATCVETNGTGSPCSSLFTLATPSDGSAPVDTAQAAVNIAQHPGSQVGALYALAQPTLGTAPFQPALNSAPSDFTIAVYYSIVVSPPASSQGMAVDGAGNIWTVNSFIQSTTQYQLSKFNSDVILPGYTFSGGGLASPQAIAIDETGNVWISNDGFNSHGTVSTLSEFNNAGGVISPATGFVAQQGSYAPGLAIDATGNLWLGESGSSSDLVVLNGSTGSVISPAGGYTSSGLAYPPVLAIDGSGNVWAAANTNIVTRFSSNGVPISTSSGGGLYFPTSIAVDSASNIWVLNSANLSMFGQLIGPGTVSKFNGTTGAAIPPSTGYALGSTTIPTGMAIDGLGNVWVVNTSLVTCSCPSVFELNGTTGALISGATGYVGGGMNTPRSLVVDGSGNVWVANNDSSLTEFIGLAAPVVTPLAVAVQNNTLGKRP